MVGKIVNPNTAGSIVLTLQKKDIIQDYRFNCYSNDKQVIQSKHKSNQVPCPLNALRIYLLYLSEQYHSIKQTYETFDFRQTVFSIGFYYADLCRVRTKTD
ncbi:MAG: hypothetical protein MdMp024_1423 [Bacteroidales bacterium]